MLSKMKPYEIDNLKSFSEVLERARRLIPDNGDQHLLR